MRVRVTGEGWGVRGEMRVRVTVKVRVGVRVKSVGG